MKTNFLILIFFVISTYSKAGIDKAPNLYLIVIGIDNYSEPLQNFYSCVSDSKMIEKKIQNDYIDKYKDHIKGIGEVFLYNFYNSDATKSNIRNAISKIALKAKPNDIFIFFYAGYSIENEKNQTYIVPYLSEGYEKILESKEIISLKSFSTWINEIKTKNQLFISEAGNGTMFSLNLLKAFVNKQNINNNENFNRIIISTNYLGKEGFNCEGKKQKQGGILAYLLSQNSNILNSIFETDMFEFEILNDEISCNPLDRTQIYTRVYKESDYKQLFMK